MGADKGLLVGKGILQGYPHVPAAGLPARPQRCALCRKPKSLLAAASPPPAPHLSPGLQTRPSLSADTPRAGGYQPSSAVFLRLREVGRGGPANASAVVQPHRHGAAGRTRGSWHGWERGEDRGVGEEERGGDPLGRVLEAQKARPAAHGVSAVRCQQVKFGAVRRRFGMLGHGKSYGKVAQLPSKLWS